jgi:hypothetical protein
VIRDLNVQKNNRRVLERMGISVSHKYVDLSMGENSS